MATSDQARLRKNRNRSLVPTTDPDKRMSSKKRPPVAVTNTPSDSAVDKILAWFGSQEDAADRFRWSLRDSLDELLDGQRTGRWAYQHLKKTEKTYLGTAVEVNFTKEFDIADGQTLDWLINEVEVDCKFSKDFGNWEIPMEMYLCEDHEERSGQDDHVAVLLWMTDDTSEWCAGVTRVTDNDLAFKANGQRAYNGDNKRKLSAVGLSKVQWLWGGLQDDLPRNQLLHLPESTRDQILNGPSGQQRIDALFRNVRSEIVSRSTVLTVAREDDAMKRVRDARRPQDLGGEGILVLGHQNADPHIARQLNLPVPAKGEFVSCAMAEASNGVGIFLGDSWWETSKEVTHNQLPARSSYKHFKQHDLEGN